MWVIRSLLNYQRKGWITLCLNELEMRGVHYASLHINTLLSQNKPAIFTRLIAVKWHAKFQENERRGLDMLRISKWAKVRTIPL